MSYNPAPKVEIPNTRLAMKKTTFTAMMFVRGVVLGEGLSREVLGV